MATTMVHVRVDEKTKRRAAETLADMGISVSDAIRMLLVRVAAEKALPFEVRVPNATTIKAMRAAEKGGGKRPVQGSGNLTRCETLYAEPSPPRCETYPETRQGYAKLRDVIPLLIWGNPLPVRYRDHPLSGEWKRACGVGGKNCSITSVSFGHGPSQLAKTYNRK
jgi:DNA-damage-inducible protein J